MKKIKLSRLSEHYQEALGTYFEQYPPANLKAALELGYEAVSMGLETLDLAGIHDQSLATLLLPDYSPAMRDDMTARASIFFTEAVIPVEETHRIAVEASADLHQLNATLQQRTLELVDSNRELQQEISDRKNSEAALKDSEKTSDRLVRESRLLEKHLQDIARRILSAQEEERRKMSHQLYDEIAQTLLGIHVRLLSLKKQAASNQTGITKEISITQQLVEQSVKIINKLVGEFGKPHEK